MTTTTVTTRVHDPLEFEVIAEGLGFPEGPCIAADGTVYAVDIKEATVIKADGNGSAEVVASLSGGPNGMALRADGTAVVANNGGFLWTELMGRHVPMDLATHVSEPPGFEKGWLDQVDLATGEVTELHDSCGDRLLRGPNDVVYDEVGGLWFTDLGKGRHADVDRGGLYYLPPHGDAVQAAAVPLLGPNGVGLAPDGRTVYAAETHTGRLWAWPVAEPGVISGVGECIGATKFAFDSLAVEADGRIVCAGITAGLVVITPDGSEIDVHPIPLDVTTNIAFGGADGRRAVITLSGSGRLAETTWPRPGLASNVP